jgi:hypothetical protein
MKARATGGVALAFLFVDKFWPDYLLRDKYLPLSSRQLQITLCHTDTRSNCMSNQEWKKPGDTVYLDVSEVNAFEPPIFLPGFNGGGYGKDPNKIFQMSSKVARSALSARTAMEYEYQRKTAELPAQIQAEMSNNGVQNIYAETNSDSGTLQKDQSIINQLIHQKNGSLQKHMREANSFYGSDSHTKSEGEYIVHFNRHMRQDRSPGSTNKHWITSYLAGYSVKLDTESIRLLTDRSNQLHTAYTQALAREELARQAEAQAREAAAQQAEAQAREAATLQVERERSESNLKAKSLTTASGASANVKLLSISADGVIEGYDVFTLPGVIWIQGRLRLQQRRSADWLGCSRRRFIRPRSEMASFNAPLWC